MQVTQKYNEYNKTHLDSRNRNIHNKIISDERNLPQGKRLTNFPGLQDGQYGK